MTGEFEVAPAVHGHALAIELCPVVLLTSSLGRGVLFLLSNDTCHTRSTCQNLIEGIEQARAIVHTRLLGMEITDTSVVGVELGIIFGIRL